MTGWGALLVALLGAAAGAVATYLLLGRAEHARAARSTTPAIDAEDVHGLGSDVARLLDALPGANVVLTVTGLVVRVSERADDLGLTKDGLIVVPGIDSLVRQVGRDARPREADVSVGKPRRGARERVLRVRVTPLRKRLLLVLAEDVSETRRVEAVRRDFVANVSHELKTPVGALALLAEAVRSAADDPETVRRFAVRMQSESVRLSRMVDDLLDLSRLQDDDPLSHAAAVDVDTVVVEAVEEASTAADAKSIQLLSGGEEGLVVFGDRSQLATALRNLVVNAVAYSPPGTRVAIARRIVGGDLEISVTDQGLGIAERDQERIFERFYRVDPARSRDTGGTGLGLAIVKRVCENHGGEVSVWSRLGEGATFTIKVPVHADLLGPTADDMAAEPEGDTSSATVIPFGKRVS